MRLYTMLQAAKKLGVCKSAVYEKVKRLNLGTPNDKGVIFLTPQEVRSLKFRARNKKPYKRKMKKIIYKR